MENYFVGKSADIKAETHGVISVRDLLTELMSEDVSVAVVELNGVNRKVVNKVSRVFYFVLEGEGVFNIEGNEHFVGEGDFVLIPPGTSYFDKGEMKLLSVCTPRFDPNNLEYLD